MKPQPLSRPPILNPQTVWGLVFIGAIALSLYQAGIWGQDVLNPGGFSLLGRFLQASLQPELSPEFLQLTLEATLTTLAYAVCGTAEECQHYRLFDYADGSRGLGEWN
ncbi:hypothetical protein [Coleofasciculus sp.]|uniref:hypothetical protein n=1 Tax=Coleofasciculus sp. TaxID=3100458 RepID=UPI003A18F871